MIVGLRAYPLIKKARTDNASDDRAVQKVGSAEAQASCSTATSTLASGWSNHWLEDCPIDYEAAPPAFVPRYAVPAPFARKFCTLQDRPAVPTLVHNLEHGFTILWHAGTVAESDQRLTEVRAIVTLSKNDSGRRGKFIAAPWAEADGTSFPGGKHIASTHWSFAGGPESDSQVGVARHCAQPSGEGVARFVQAYPSPDSPEPDVG